MNLKTRWIDLDIFGAGIPFSVAAVDTDCGLV